MVPRFRKDNLDWEQDDSGSATLAARSGVGPPAYLNLFTISDSLYGLLTKSNASISPCALSAGAA